MPSAITQNIGTAVSQALSNPQATRTNSTQDIPSEQLVKAAQVAGQLEASRFKNEEERSPRIPKQVEASYGPQIKNKNKKKRQAQDKSSEDEAETPKLDNQNDKEIDVLA